MTSVKKPFHRPSRPRSRKRSSNRDLPAVARVRRSQSRGRGKDSFEKPKIDPQLRPIFNKIGVPDTKPLKPDPFQLEAFDLIRDYDVLVSAPTGSGKTWIASQTIHLYLSEDLRVWYASPLKALSNSIYQEFCHEFGPHYCGILTGDRKENPEAPVIVGTTEILRNQLYDAMHKGINIRTDLVILDEAHYLSDPERGVVWEEVLIYLPSRVRLLLLSATISNAEEVCAWLREIRRTSNRVVRVEERPVPFETLFLFPDGLIAPLGGKKRLNPRVKKFFASQRGKRRRWSAKIDFGNIIACLREFDLLPAIFFLKSRADCDKAILACPPVDRPPESRKRLRNAIKAFLRDYPHLKGHRQMRPLLESLVVSHHGGQLPYWKVLIEKMMNKGLLEAIFSTSTVAAGVNFPARTVALVQSDRYNGNEFSDLTATELHQMIGRAGRRGKDYIGFALIIPGIHQDPQLIYELMNSSPEPLVSQIHINFSMTLNLLLSHTPSEVKELLERSFAAFQEKASGIRPKKWLWQSFRYHLQFLKETGFVDDMERLTPDGYWASRLRLDQPLLIAEAIRKGALDGLPPEVLTGIIAPFVWDKFLEIEIRINGVMDLGVMEASFNNVLNHIEQIRALKHERGFESPPILFWPAAALFLWAKGVPWEQLLNFVPIDEGNMASLIMRTADHLRQVTNLMDTHPELGSVSNEAIDLILREPVYIL